MNNSDAGAALPPEARTLILQVVDYDTSYADFSWEKFNELLIGLIVKLLRDDYPRLRQILYRIDVREKDAERAFSAGNIEAIAQALATAIIDRQREKWHYRQENK